MECEDSGSKARGEIESEDPTLVRISEERWSPRILDPTVVRVPSESITESPINDIVILHDFGV